MTDRHAWRGGRPQNLSWFIDHFKRGSLDLDPPYQRRSVWSQRYRDDFIETVLLGYPAPSIFLYEEFSDEGQPRYSVVDGKQRLTTVIEFDDNAFPTPDGSETGLDAALRGKYLKDLPGDVRNAFWGYELTVELIPSTDSALLKDVFDRLNRNVLRLTRQELRHARWSGAFAKEAEAAAAEMLPLVDARFPQIAPASRRQMKDVEFAAFLLLLVERGPDSDSQDELDEIYGQRDDEWPDAKQVRRDFTRVLNLIQDLLDVVPELANSRLRNQGDYYALVGAVHELQVEGKVPKDLAKAGNNLLKFVMPLSTTDVNPDELATQPARYYQAARSAANDLRQRKTRIEILKATFKG